MPVTVPSDPRPQPSGSGVPPTSPAPYAGLDPQTVIDALDAVGLRGDGRLLQLNSYENRVFQVYLEDGRGVVAKFYRPGRWSDAQILEEHAFAAELVSHEIPVADCLTLGIDAGALAAAAVSLRGPTLACFDSAAGPYRFGVSPRLAGRAPELEDADTLERIGRFVGRIHAVGAQGTFAHRLALTPQTFGRAARDWLLGAEVIPPDAASGWREITDRALDAVEAAFDRCRPLACLRLHGDCHPGNLLWTDKGPHFVDLDDAVTGPAVQDLWMLLSGDRAAMSRQLATVLEGYEDFMPFERRELALIEPLRTLRLLHHSAWIARRWADPAFPIAFPWFESPSYWAGQITQFREQLEAMAAPPPGHR